MKTWRINKKSARIIGQCTCLPERKIMDMQEAGREITRRQFLGYAHPEDMKLAERDLGYSRDFRMTTDWHVSYYQSIYDGVPCVYFVHSHIEWVFV